MKQDFYAHFREGKRVPRTRGDEPKKKMVGVGFRIGEVEEYEKGSHHISFHCFWQCGMRKPRLATEAPNAIFRYRWKASWSFRILAMYKAGYARDRA